MKRIATVGIAFSILLVLAGPRVRAEEKWTETKSTNFTAWSNGSDRQAQDLLWQLEQIHFAVKVLWPWTKFDLAKPMLVVGVKDEESTKALAPRYWEQKGGVRPVSVRVTGPDQDYMIIRADVRGEDGRLINPYTSAFFSYVNLILTSSFKRDLPLWFSRGLAGVQSNAIVQGNQILLGPPIPWHLQRLQTDSRLRLRELITVTRSSREYTQEDGLLRFDAQAWAVVHFLMFGENAQRREGINKLATLLASGKDPEPVLHRGLRTSRGMGKRLRGLHQSPALHLAEGSSGQRHYTREVHVTADPARADKGRVERATTHESRCGLVSGHADAHHSTRHGGACRRGHGCATTTEPATRARPRRSV